MPSHFTALLRLAAALAVVSPLVACDGGDAPQKPQRGEKPAEDAIAIRVAAIQVEPISETYSTSTTLTAEQEATVIARTTGVIQRLKVEEGDKVQAGQPIAQLEDGEQAIALARARLNREARDREYTRQQQLRAQDLTSDVEVEQARSAAEDAAEALKLADLEMDRTTIRAPFSGIILRRHLDVGASVASGTAVYDIADVDPLIAEVRIPERHVATLKAGQETRLYADAQDKVFTGQILRIAPFVDPASGTVKVTVATKGGSGLRPGAFVKVDIVTETHAAALVVPRAALVAEGRRWHLYTLAEDGQSVAQHEVGLGFEAGEKVELIPPPGAESLTVKAGDPVVVVGAPALSPDARVQVVEGDAPKEPQTQAPEAEAGAADGQP